MDHGHHGIHFVRQSKIEFICKSFKGLPDFILPKRLISLCEVSVIGLLKFISLIVSVDKTTIRLRLLILS